MIAVRVPEEIEMRLDRLAKLTGRTKTYYVREAIEDHLDDLEEAYLAEKVLEKVRSSREKLIPFEDIMKQYGLENRVCRVGCQDPRIIGQADWKANNELPAGTWGDTGSVTTVLYAILSMNRLRY